MNEEPPSLLQDIEMREKELTFCLIVLILVMTGAFGALFIWRQVDMDQRNYCFNLAVRGVDISEVDKCAKKEN